MTLRILFCNTEIGFNKDGYVRPNTGKQYARKGAKMA